MSKSEIRDGMWIDWDVPIPMDDGVVLRADVFRPLGEGKYPVIMSYGPYGKGLHFAEGYPYQWQHMLDNNPDVFAGTTGKYMNWETVDPERWVPDGYVVVRVDSRGAGRSPGVLDVWSPREAQDFYQCIEWAAQQPWSNGRVGLAGISYYAINQWQVAALQPPHLAAICPWEGAADYYRDMCYHGGIPSMFFWRTWFRAQVASVQHGVGVRGRRNPATGIPGVPGTGELVSGPETLSEEELARNRVEPAELILQHPLDDDFHRSRSPDWSRVVVPLLSCGNWGGFGLHLRGNTEGYLRAASGQKWLEVHCGPHWGEFYTEYGLALMKRFFARYLKGEENGWDETPPVLLWIRHADGSHRLRAEREWPIARTRWTRLYLDPATCSLGEGPPADGGSVEYEALGEGVTFLGPPLAEEVEITGPLALRLFISSSTRDADLFVALRAFDPNLREVTFYDYLDPHTPLSLGWLRASHRRLNPELSREWRPYHSHQVEEPLEPGQVYEVEVELWPTCVVLPRGYRLALTIRGRDYEWAGEPTQMGPYPMRGSGPFFHEEGRPAEVYGGRVRLYGGGGRDSYLLLPVVPPKGDDPDTPKVEWLARFVR